jgi:hypothetical protein
VTNYGITEFNHKTFFEDAVKRKKDAMKAQESKSDIERNERQMLEDISGESDLKTEEEKYIDSTGERSNTQRPKPYGREGGARTGDSPAGKTGNQLLTDAVHRLLEENVNAMFTPGITARVDELTKRGRGIINFLKEAAEKSTLDEEDKRDIKTALENIRIRHDLGMFESQDKDLQLLREVLKKYSDELNVDGIEVIDPIRESLGYGKEGYINRVRTDNVMRNLIDDEGRMTNSGKIDFIDLLMEQLNESAGYLNSTVGKQRLKLIQDPAPEEFKKLVPKIKEDIEQLVNDKKEFIIKKLAEKKLPQEEIDAIIKKEMEPIEVHLPKYFAALAIMDRRAATDEKVALMEEASGFFDFTLLGAPITILTNSKKKELKTKAERISSVLEEEIKQLNLELDGLKTEYQNLYPKAPKKREIKERIEEIKSMISSYKVDIQTVKSNIDQPNIELSTALGKEALDLYSKNLLPGGEEVAVPKIEPTTTGIDLEKLEMLMNNLLDKERAKGNPTDPLKESMLGMIENIRTGDKESYEENRANLEYLFGYDSEGEALKKQWFGQTDKLMIDKMGE